MKGRSVKLRESHSKAKGQSACSVLWGAPQLLVTASASDTSVAIHDLSASFAGKSGSSSASEPKLLQHHREGVTALAIAPGPALLASASIDHSVKLYCFPGGEFQGNVTRFTLPIWSLAFSKSGSLLAAAGDDDGIKLIATIDNSISKVLKGHKGSVTGLSFDPKNEYLASIDGFGTVIFWELSSGQELHTLKAVAPICESDESVLNAISWRPDGEMLAVPGLCNDIVMYDRDTSEKLFVLKGGHEQPICALCWSPNGKYLATSALDNQVFIWDVDSRQDIERQKFDERISGLSWKPEGNALAVIDVLGRFGILESPVPLTMKSPTEGIPNLPTSKITLFDDDEDMKPSTSDGGLDDDIDESLGESVQVSHKRARLHYAFGKSSEEESEGEDDLLQLIESRKKTAKLEKCNKKEMDACVTSGTLSLTRMQQAFQPGSTPTEAGKRRFLCYSMLGCITAVENESHSHIEVDFHDTGRGPRFPAMTDYFGFTMASLNETGCVFASPFKGEKSMSTVMYRPFSSWANNSEWSMRFEGEEVNAVALGTNWVAAVTSLNYLRIFSSGGMQRHVLCVDGPVVTAAGFKDKLAIVTHSAGLLPSGDQILDVKVFNISEGTQTISTRVSLTPSSHLSWFGFSEQGQLSAYDSKGVLRVFDAQFGGSWLPLFSSSKARKSDGETHWLVGLDANSVYCIVCTSAEPYPQVSPKPVLSILDLSIPLASSDLGADSHENEFIMRNIQLKQIHRKIEEMEALGQDVTALDDEAFNTEAAIDRCILRLISCCCNGDKLARATELAKLLTLEKSVRGAITLASRLKLPLLAEKFSELLEERLARTTPSASSAPAPNTRVHSIFTKNSSPVVSPATPSTSGAEPSVTASQPAKPETQEKAAKLRSSTVEPVTTAAAPQEAQLSRTTNCSTKLPDTQEKGSGNRGRETKPAALSGSAGGKESKQGRPPVRPSNPFAKSAAGKEKPTSLV